MVGDTDFLDLCLSCLSFRTIASGKSFTFRDIYPSLIIRCQITKEYEKIQPETDLQMFQVVLSTGILQDIAKGWCLRPEFNSSLNQSAT